MFPLYLIYLELLGTVTESKYFVVLPPPSSFIEYSQFDLCKFLAMQQQPAPVVILRSGTNGQLRHLNREAKTPSFRVLHQREDAQKVADTMKIHLIICISQ